MCKSGGKAQLWRSALQALRKNETVEIYIIRHYYLDFYAQTKFFL